MAIELSHSLNTELDNNISTKSYCYGCNIEINSKIHEEETEHLLRMNFFSQYFIEKSKDSVKCKICCENILEYDLNKHMVQHELIPWHRPKDEFQKYFTNFIASSDNTYLCYLCHKEVKYWFQAILHCMNPEHVLQMTKIDKEIFNTPLTFELYKQCVLHSIYPFLINSVICYVCDFPIKYENIEKHILSKKHSKLFISKQTDNKLLPQNSRNFVLHFPPTALYPQYFENFIGILEKDKHWCHLCRSQFSNWDKTKHHIESPEHQSALKTPIDKKNIGTSLSLDFYRKCVQHNIFPKSFNELQCFICGCCIPGYQNLDEHISGKYHKQKKKTYNFLHYPSHCNNIDKQQIKKPNNVNDQCIKNFIGMIENTYWCFICCRALYSRDSVVSHLQSLKHQSKRMNFIYIKNINMKVPPKFSKDCLQQGIFPISHQTIRCFICKCTISTLDSCVKEHVTGKKHKQLCLDWKLLLKNIKSTKNRSDNKKSKKILLNNRNSDHNIDGDDVPKTCETHIDTDSKEKATTSKKSKTLKNKMINNKAGVCNSVKNESVASFACNICKQNFKSEIIFHIHLTYHFWPCFIQQNGCQETAINASSQHRQFDINQNLEDLISHKNCSQKNDLLIVQNRDLENLIEAADIRPDEARKINIYKIDSIQLEMINLSVTRCYFSDEKNIYCLICREKISCSIITVFEHFRSINHINYLFQMIQDHTKSMSFPDQFSDFSLAREWMEDISDDVIKCYGCQKQIKNDIPSLMKHSSENNHMYQRSRLALKIDMFFDSLYSVMKRNWYNVKVYWCVPCRKAYALENEFYKHIYASDKNNEHLKKCQEFLKFSNLIFDYCPTCTALFYGFQYTFAYHCKIEKHKYFLKQPFYFVNQLPSAVEDMLSEPDSMINETIELLDAGAQKRSEDEHLIIENLETIVNHSMSAKAYAFGSRVCELSSETSDFDIFLDYGNRYYLGRKRDDVSHILHQVEDCFKRCTGIWVINRTIINCTVPIIKVTYKPLDIKCDISVLNGLTVECSQLMKTINQKLPLCRKLILFAKQWINKCNLIGERGISSYAVAWMVIYYLQTKSLIKPIITLIKDRNESKIIGGWETGASLDFSIPETKESFKDCLKGFFEMITTFDFRNKIICPFLGKSLEKRCFSDATRLLPKEMETYKQNSKQEHHEPFSIDSPLCVQDPYVLSDNITKATQKIMLSKLRALSVLTLNKLNNDDSN